MSKKDANSFLKAVRKFGRIERMADIAEEVGSVLKDQSASARSNPSCNRFLVRCIVHQEAMGLWSCAPNNDEEYSSEFQVVDDASGLREELRGRSHRGNYVVLCCSNTAAASRGICTREYCSPILMTGTLISLCAI